MTSLPRFSVDNPVLINLVMVVLLVGGGYSSLTIIREMFPESRPNRVLVSTEYPGATPSEVEKGITLKIEEQIKEVEGVEKITSTINEGLSRVYVELESGFDNIDQAINDIKAAIDTIPSEDLPEEARETRVAKSEPKWSVISVSLFGDLDDRVLKGLGQRLRDDLLALPGISNVALSGTRKDEISVEVSPAKLAEFGLSFMDVAGAIRASNLDLPGGQIRTAGANISVRTLGEKDRGEELYDIVIKSDPSGRTVRLRDVATIVDGFEDEDVSGRFNGKRAVSVTVYQGAGQDAITIAGMVRALVAGKMGRPLELSWRQKLAAVFSRHDRLQDIHQAARNDPYPQGVEVEVHIDLSQFIEGRLNLLTRNGFWGLILVSLSLLVSLHWRFACWVVMGLLLAIAGALICMNLMGHTLNLISMFGLIIVLGLLVDDAIIVAEHVYTKIEQGVEPRLAAISGTEAVTWPVVCAIITTVVAFVPLMFIEGQMGDWMGTLPVIVCIALTISLVEALGILPAHLAHGVGSAAPNTEIAHAKPTNALRLFARRIRLWQKKLQTKMRVHYERILRISATYRYVTMGGLLSCLIVVVAVVLAGHVPFVFIQKVDSETLVTRLKMGVGTPIAATQRAVSVVERAAMDLEELKTIYTLLGMQVTDDGQVTAPQSHVAQSFIELVPAAQRERSSDEILQVLRAKTAEIPGVERLSFGSIQGGPGGAAIHLDISGEHLDDLIAVSEEIKQTLATFAGVFDIVDNFDAGRREVRIELFDSARALGLTTQSLAIQVRAAFHGFEARKVQRQREDVKIMVRYPPQFRRRIYDIESMRIATPSGALVPFTEVASLTEGTGYASIRRTNQKRTVAVMADVDDEVTTSDRVIQALKADFPQILERYPGLALTFGGHKLETTKSFASLKGGFTAALMMIYVVLAGLFRSYVQPFIVMAVIPFGLIGAVFGHFVMGYPLTILSAIGLVALTGIVVNDSMILVVFINRLRASGVDAFEAVIEGGKGRLRPILLTSVTTVLGIAPLLAEQSFQARFLIPMGLSISAGLIFATVLTLFAIPSLYLIVIDLKQLIGAAPFRAEDQSQHRSISEVPLSG